MREEIEVFIRELPIDKVISNSYVANYLNAKNKSRGLDDRCVSRLLRERDELCHVGRGSWIKKQGVPL
jgi:hypothetical protein